MFRREKTPGQEKQTAVGWMEDENDPDLELWKIIFDGKVLEFKKLINVGCTPACGAFSAMEEIWARAAGG